MSRRALVFAACAVVFLWAAYRAATAAVTTEEAITYNHYVSQGTAKMFTAPLNPANQVLHSYICRLFLHIWRVTEWWLRFPSLLGLLFYFGAAVQACRRLCQPGAPAFIASLLFVVNPFTVGWLPVSSGIWAGAGLFLLATAQLLPALWQKGPFDSRLWKASLLVGVATGFHNSLLPVSVALLFLFLHFEFWSQRRIPFWTALNHLFMPFALTVFALWSLTLLAGAAPLHLEAMCVVLLPGFAALSLPWLAAHGSVWKTVAPVAVVIIATCAVYAVPNLFRAGPEADVPSGVRVLREEIRRFPVRTVTVSTDPEYREALEFYCRRYSLGAVRLLASPRKPADYLVVRLSDAAGKSGRIIFKSGNLALVSTDRR